ncbi:hypothetical protein L1887_06019 [Cichorium endivia]|nr:hypothetical protein L1887_35004 [Cichorium endivia]KAI3526757.1 hypothetical protein L1887_06019 [Cichorium endivia]
MDEFGMLAKDFGFRPQGKSAPTKSNAGDRPSRNVVGIDPDNAILTGELPVELGNLSMLEVIRAGGNKDISGKILYELGNCRNLKVLGLAVTKISGSIPSSLGSLRKLQTLSVYTILLSGEIPKELGNCSDPVDLYLYENDLTSSPPKPTQQSDHLVEINQGWRPMTVREERRSGCSCG